jgi:hypothetical protein
MSIEDQINKAIREDPRLNYLLFQDINPDHESVAIKVLRQRLAQVALVENQLRVKRNSLDNQLLDKLIKYQEMARMIEKVIHLIETDEVFEGEIEPDEDIPCVKYTFDFESGKMKVIPVKDEEQK